jgi:hypothetical protein
MSCEQAYTEVEKLFIEWDVNNDEYISIEDIEASGKSV